MRFVCVDGAVFCLHAICIWVCGAVCLFTCGFYFGLVVLYFIFVMQHNVCHANINSFSENSTFAILLSKTC